jgi:hypothetical protein
MLNFTVHINPASIIFIMTNLITSIIPPYILDCKLDNQGIRAQFLAGQENSLFLYGLKASYPIDRELFFLRVKQPGHEAFCSPQSNTTARFVELYLHFHTSS